MNKNDGLKIFGKFIAPSLLELLSVVCVFLILVIANQIHQLYSKDLTSLGAATFKGTALSGPARHLSMLYDSKGFSTIAVYVFWLVVALLIYAMATRFTKNAKEVASDISIRHYLWPKGTNRNYPIKEYAEKFGMKLIVLVAFCLYVIKFSPVLLNWWRFHHILLSVSVHALTIYVILLLFMALYIHGLVLLMRALILRLRIVNI